MATVVEVRDLRKAYGPLVAVDGVSFDIRAGEVYALLGHNGAGKSTTVEILEGHRRRDGGDVAVLGMDPATGGRALRERIGIVLQASGIEPELTVAEALDLYGSCYRDPRPAAELLELVDLAAKADARIGSLSGGQRRRIDLALGIVGRPEVLFLDEPTTGFDPAARRRAWEVVEGLCADGTTVVLTTHYLDEAEHLADRVGVLVGGRLVAEGAPSQLIEGLAGCQVSFALPADTAPADLAGVVPAGAAFTAGRVEFTTTTPTSDVHAITSWAVARGIELDGLTVVRPSLEDVFLGLASEEPV